MIPKIKSTGLLLLAMVMMLGTVSGNFPICQDPLAVGPHTGIAASFLVDPPPWDKNCAVQISSAYGCGFSTEYGCQNFLCMSRAGVMIGLQTAKPIPLFQDVDLTHPRDALDSTFFNRVSFLQRPAPHPIPIYKSVQSYLC